MFANGLGAFFDVPAALVALDPPVPEAPAVLVVHLLLLHAHLEAAAGVEVKGADGVGDVGDQGEGVQLRTSQCFETNALFSSFIL